MRRLRLGSLVVFSTSIVAATANPSLAQTSRAMSVECAGVANSPASRAKGEQWVQEKLRAFLPTPAQSLRMTSFDAQAEQVKLALYGIGSTCEQYLAGKLEKTQADLSLGGFEQTISEFLHDIGDEAVLLAAKGQVSDMNAIRSTLTVIGATGRQAALLGEDALADRSQQQMVRALIQFSSAFVGQTCWDQVFSDDLPLTINQQNEILGTGIDVRPCAQRRFTARVENFTFESCTVRGIGDWRVRWNLATPMGTSGTGSGKLENERDRAKGDYSADWGANGVEYRASGTMELVRRDGSPGAGEEASYTLSGDMDVRITKGKELIAMMEKLMNQKTKPTKGSFSVTPQVSDKPCKSLDR